MTTYEPYYDDLDDPDDLGADLSAEEPDPEAAAAEAAIDDLAALADDYSAANPRRRREIWAGLDPDEQDHLRAMGIAGPVNATVDQDYEPVQPSDPGYASVVSQSASIVHAGLRQINSGDLDVEPELAAEIADLSERSDRFDDATPVRGRLLQRAAHLIEQAKQAAADAIPFAEHEIIRRESHGLQADGRYLSTEMDRRGRMREIWLTPEELEEAEAALAEEERDGPLDLPKPGEVTIEEVASWSQARYRAWAAKYPGAEERLLQAASVHMMGGER